MDRNSPIEVSGLPDVFVSENSKSAYSRIQSGSRLLARDLGVYPLTHSIGGIFRAFMCSLYFAIGVI